MQEEFKFSLLPRLGLTLRTNIKNIVKMSFFFFFPLSLFRFQNQSSLLVIDVVARLIIQLKFISITGNQI